MANKTVKTRFQIKRGTSADWTAATNFTPLEGEIIFYSDLNKFKVGKKDSDGNLILLSELPFLDSDTLDGKHASEFVLEGDSRLTDSRTPKSHASSSTTYGAATTSKYGHVKISNGDVASVASANGLAAGMDHSHSNYASSTHTHTLTTGEASPNTHTHTLVVKGTSGSNSGTAVTVATGSVSSSGTGATVVTGSSGTTTFLKGVKAGSTDTFLKSINSGSGTLESYDAATAGTVVTANGTRIPFIADVTHTAASLTGTKTFVTGVTTGSGSLTSDTTSTNGIAYISAQGTFSAGSLPSLTVTSKSPSKISSWSAGTMFNASYNSGVLTLSAGSVPSLSYSAETVGSASGWSTGSLPSLGSATTKYLHHTHTSASSAGTGTVGISGGSISKTTYYLAHTHTGASANVSASAVTTVASDGTGTGVTGLSTSKLVTSSAAPNSHTHSYGSDTALTTSANSGDAVTVVTNVE